MLHGLVQAALTDPSLLGRCLTRQLGVNALHEVHHLVEPRIELLIKLGTASLYLDDALLLEIKPGLKLRDAINGLRGSRRMARSLCRSWCTGGCIILFHHRKGGRCADAFCSCLGFLRRGLTRGAGALTTGPLEVRYWSLGGAAAAPTTQVRTPSFT